MYVFPLVGVAATWSMGVRSMGGGGGFVVWRSSMCTFPRVVLALRGKGMQILSTDRGRSDARETVSLALSASRQPIDYISQSIPTTHSQPRQYGRPPRPLPILSLYLPPHRPRPALPAPPTTRPAHPHTTTPPTISSRSAGLSHTHTSTPRRPMGWTVERRTQKEDLPHEETIPADGVRKAFERCHGVE